MLFAVPEVILIICLFTKVKNDNLPRKEALYIAVVSEIMIMFYIIVYCFEKNTAYIAYASNSVLCAFVSYTDIKEKMISVRYCYAMMLVSVLFLFLRDDISLFNPVVSAILMFLIIKIVKKICKNQIGDGDVYLITAYVAVYGFPLFVKVVFLSLLLGLIAGVCGVVFRKFSMKTELPFAPFILLGGVLTEIVGRF